MRGMQADMTAWLFNCCCFFSHYDHRRRHGSGRYGHSEYKMATDGFGDSTFSTYPLGYAVLLFTDNQIHSCTATIEVWHKNSEKCVQSDGFFGIQILQNQFRPARTMLGILRRSPDPLGRGYLLPIPLPVDSFGISLLMFSASTLSVLLAPDVLCCGHSTFKSMPPPSVMTPRDAGTHVAARHKACIPRRRHRHPREDPRRHVRHARFSEFIPVAS